MMKGYSGGKAAPKPKAKSPKIDQGVYEQPEDDVDEGDGSPAKSDSSSNKKARRAIFMKRLMDKKK